MLEWVRSVTDAKKVNVFLHNARVMELAEVSDTVQTNTSHEAKLYATGN